MALDTYANLQTEIAGWLDRTDLTSQIPTFIDLVEADINESVRHPRMIERAYSSVTTEFVDLPTDFLEMAGVHILANSIRYTLEHRGEEQMDIEHQGASGHPTIFTLLGTEMRLYPTPDSTYRVEMTYYEQLPALTDSNTTNWLLTWKPHVYLYGALYYAAIYLKDGDLKRDAGEKYVAGLKAIEKDAYRSKWRGRALAMRVA